ncbi:MAG TPA: hypothetical protein VLZ30_12465 [Verrucomicrobiae bacterium]|nr:hypothetical protein [Verrucomicrobiae bacterium]
MRITIALAMALAPLVSACSYSHVGLPVATFSQPVPPLGAGSLEAQVGPLALRIQRHLDTVLHGPDNEEDQSLVLEVHNFQINRRLQVLSDNVTPEFTATRFGPTSKGQTFVGYLIVKKVTPHQVDAYLHIDVTASTPSGSYTQTAKFHGNFTFVRSTEEAPRR